MATLRALAKLDAYGELARVVTNGNFEVDESGFTSMHAAACIGDIASIDRFARDGADPNVDDGWGWTPLIEATKRGHLTAVVRLLELGASAQPHSAKAPPALWFAASHGYIMAMTRSGRYLEGAAALVYTELTKVLLDAGADPNCAYGSISALDQASRYASCATVELLLRSGADPQSGNPIARACTRAVGYDASERARKFNLLLPTATPDQLSQALGDLICSYSRDDLPFVQQLLDTGADANAKDTYGWTSLHHAVGKDDPSLIQMLVAYGADPTIKVHHDPTDGIPDDIASKGMDATALATYYGCDDAKWWARSRP